MVKHHLIVGGGLSSLMLATKLKLDDSSCKVTVVERESELGGMYRSFDYSEFGYFDHGMHIFYETCIKEIDEILINSIGEDAWNFGEGNRKDIAGLYFNGKLQSHSPYLDLRAWPEKFLRSVYYELIQPLKIDSSPDTSSAMNYLRTRFGRTIAEEAFAPILQKLYQTNPEELDVLAVYLITATDRVILFDEAEMLDLMQSNLLRSRLALPNQMALPLQYRSSGQRSFYPKKFGMTHVIEAFKTKLQAKGVEFLLDSSIKSLTKDASQRIVAVTINQRGQEREMTSIDQLIWTAGLIPLALTLGLELNLPKTKKKKPSYYVNLILAEKPNMGELYYLYCYDSAFSTFRITHYSNYCPAARSEHGYPLCVEFWPPEESALSEAEVVVRVLNELKAFGVLSDEKVVFSRVEPVREGFPVPTFESIRSLAKIRQRIKDLGISNLVNTGVLAEENVFFFKDVLLDGFKKIQGKAL